MSTNSGVTFHQAFDPVNQEYWIWFTDMNGNHIDGLTGTTDISAMSTEEIQEMADTFEQAGDQELLAIFAERFDEYYKGMAGSDETH